MGCLKPDVHDSHRAPLIRTACADIPGAKSCADGMTLTVSDDTRWPPEEFSSWEDWVGPLERTAAFPEGRDLVRWAGQVVAEFYTDGWFARGAASRQLPVMGSLYDWPLSSPLALMRLVERAARIAVLPEASRARLSDGVNGIRNSTNVTEFDHLDLVLEVAGLAIRDGWMVEVEVPSPDGKVPDLRLTKGTMRYTVEATIQGTDRRMRAVDLQSDRLFAQRFAIEIAHQVQCVLRVPDLLSDDDLTKYVGLIDAEAARVASGEEPREVVFGAASALVYPRGQLPEGTSLYEGPLLTGDMWPRFAARLHQKAENTRSAGATWIRIDEEGGLLALTPAVHLSLEEQLARLRHNVRLELDRYPHLRGVLISHGAGADWQPNRAQPVVTEASSAASAFERRLPGGRRRRVFTIPIRPSRTLSLPDHLVMRPSYWYLNEPSWLDWALNTLGRPSATRLVTGELARMLIP